MHAQDVCIGGWLRCDEIGRLGEMFFEQTIANQPVLLRGKDMLAQIQVVAIVVNELKGKHSRIGAP